MNRSYLAGITVLLSVASVAPSAFAKPPSDSARIESFAPQPISEPRYGIRRPADDPALRHYVEVGDGTPIYVETAVPVALEGGPKPPERVPVILDMTPYSTSAARPPAGALIGPFEALIDYYVPRGYAVAIGHIYGTGNSGGCFRNLDDVDIEAAVSVVEYLGRDFPRSNGRVGMFGGSQDGATQLGVAGWPERDRVKYLEAITPFEAPTGFYDGNLHLDGVPATGSGTANFGAMTGLSAAPPNELNPLSWGDLYRERSSCTASNLADAWEVDQTGDYTELAAARDLREEAGNIRAATFMIQGLRDATVSPMNAVGMFDGIRNGTPRKLLLGQWDHGASYADYRGDVLTMIHAWFDRYLMDLPTGVESWPRVQIQDNLLNWRTEADWPATDGVRGQLALGAGGELGTEAPTGSTKFRVSSEGATFTTPPIVEALHLTGMPVLDLWVKVLDADDAHLVVTYEALDAQGQRIPDHTNFAYGARSIQHLDPLRDGYFRQAMAEPVEPGKVYRVPIRLMPADLVIPAGGSLRMTVSGLNITVPATGAPPVVPANDATVEILHDCAYPSALRFVMPDPNTTWLEVQGPAPQSPSARFSAGLAPDDGVTEMAAAPVCNRQPADPLKVVGF